MVCLSFWDMSCDPEFRILISVQKMWPYMGLSYWETSINLFFTPASLREVGLCLPKRKNLTKVIEIRDNQYKLCMYCHQNFFGGKNVWSDSATQTNHTLKCIFKRNWLIPTPPAISIKNLKKTIKTASSFVISAG